MLCAGAQSFLRMVIAHTSQVFFCGTEDGLSSQVRVCVCEGGGRGGGGGGGVGGGGWGGGTNDVV